MANWKALTIISIIIGLFGLIVVVILYTTTGGHIPFDVRFLLNFYSNID